jgi:hypothetical protein
MPSISYLYDDVAKLHQHLEHLFTAQADQLALDTNFSQRPAIFSGASFARTLVFGYLHNPTATLPQLASYAADFGAQLSTQALEQRFNQHSAAFMKRILELALQIMVKAEALTLPLYARFNGIYILDATTIALPAALAAQWPALGNSATQPQAAVKVFVMVELCTGQVWVELCAANTSDLASQLATMPLPAGALRIADLGFYKAGQFIALAQAGAYVLTRWRANTKLYLGQGRELKLVTFLRQCQQDAVERQVYLGQQRFCCRLLAQRVPAALVEQRRADLLKEAKRRGTAVNAERLALIDWDIMFSNVPAKLLALHESRTVYRLRWQIELLFKLWKQEGKVDESRSGKAWHILSEMYAKLTAMLIHQWLVVLGCWGEVERAMLKLAQVVRASSAMLLSHWEAGVATWEKLVARLRREASLHCKVNKQRQRPAAHQLVASITLCP